MRIAITGGTGFIGSHLAKRLVELGHEVVLISRGVDRRDPSAALLPRSRFLPIGTRSENNLAAAFEGCDAVAHCAGINREIGAQTYQRVHVEGTRNVVRAAQRAGVKKIAFVSFLRARPNCGSGYHESKWAAEEILREGGIDYTILRPGVVYGRGDHMLDHLSHALQTFPIFALVGFKEKSVRPLAVEDLVRILAVALTDNQLSRRTVAVTGPEEMPLGEAVHRVAEAVGRKPLKLRAPIFFHYALAWFLERAMAVPLASLAQVRILSEGVTGPALACDELPADLLPQIRFERGQIDRGLPEPGGFGLRDLRCCCIGAMRGD